MFQASMVDYLIPIRPAFEPGPVLLSRIREVGWLLPHGPKIDLTIL
jgi:hypothetical protein